MINVLRHIHITPGYIESMLYSRYAGTGEFDHF